MSYNLSLSAKEIDETLAGAKDFLGRNPATEAYVDEAIGKIELTPGPVGPQGPKGETGATGYTPAKGVDYWTEADKQEIIDDILEALPAAEGVSF